MKRYSAYIYLALSLILLLWVYTPSFVEYGLKENMYEAYCDLVLVIYVLSLVNLLCAKIITLKWFVLLVIIIHPLHCSHLKYEQHYRCKLDKTSSYYVNAAIFNKAYLWGQNKGIGGYYRTDCYSVENGSILTIDQYHTKDETILVKMSLDGFVIRVIDLHPSSSDIQKYMEPVLFIDSVEQSRPEYDDLRLSADEHRKLLYKYSLRAVPVVKKEHDMFLRNLVTFQINDTLQKTVNLMYKDEKDFEKIFDSLDKDSKVIVKVSEINPKVIEVVSWRPTDKDIKGLRNVVEVDKRLESEIMADSASIKLLEKYAVGVQSTKKVDGSRIATVVKLSKKNFKRNMKTLTHYYVQIEDSTFKSEPIELDEINGKYIFYKLQEGSKVVYRKKEDGSTEVLNWTPTQEEVKLYNSAL